MFVGIVSDSNMHFPHVFFLKEKTVTGDRWRQADIPISGKPARPNSEPKNVRGRSVGIHPSSLRFVEVLVFVFVWNNKKRMYIYI